MDEFLLRQIQSAGDQRDRAAVTARVANACWPAGMDDRAQPVALVWLRQWWPERLGAEIPVCSCATGHCPVCN
jgi:hypothetical protein